MVSAIATLKSHSPSQNRSFSWSKFCGFTQLALEQYMSVQHDLFEEQLSRARQSGLPSRLGLPQVPENIDEFRRTFPLSRWSDYAPLLNEKMETGLIERAKHWAYTSLHMGEGKWVPFTEEAVAAQVDTVIATLILATAKQEGDVNIGPGSKILYNIPPKPFLAAHLALELAEKYGLEGIPPVETIERLGFRESIKEGFKMALDRGVDAVISMNSIMLRVAEKFTTHAYSTVLKLAIAQPSSRSFMRLAKGLAGSKLDGRSILPRDLWKPKAIISWGSNMSAYDDQIAHYWGQRPFSVHGLTECGIIAVSDLRHSGMVMVPNAGFWEFIPVSELPRLNPNPPKDVLGDSP